MNHIPNKLDIKTDLRRSVMASFSQKRFNDKNFITFFNNALKNLDLLKKKIGESKYNEIKERANKSKDIQNSIEKRREDLLTAASLI